MTRTSDDPGPSIGSPDSDGEDRPESLRYQTVSGASWSFLNRGVRTVTHFGIGVVLARLLPPEDFGLVGLAYIVMEFGGLFVNLGLGPALIQRKTLSERHVRVALTVSTIAGSVLALGVYTSAPWTAILLDDPRVIPILEVLAISFVFSGLQVPSRALIERHLAFRKLFYVNMVNTVFYGAVTITMALQGWGVWSLVAGRLVGRLIDFMLNYAIVRHSLIPLIAKKEVKDLAGFGVGMSIADIFNYLALQGDYFVVGRVLGSRTLGLYNRAYSLMQMPTQQFVRVLTGVLFPAASKVQDDPVRFKGAYLQALTVISFFVMPVVGLLVIQAPDLIVGVYGPKWSEAIIPVQIMGGFGLLRATYNGAAAFLRAKGWVYKILVCQVVYGVLLLGGAWIAAHQWGLAGVAWVVSGSITVMWILMTFYSSRAAEASWSEVFATFQPGLVLAVPALGAAALMRLALKSTDLTSLIILLLCVGASVLVWFGLLVSVPQRWLQNLPYDLLKLAGSQEVFAQNRLFQWAVRQVKPAGSQVE